MDKKKTTTDENYKSMKLKDALKNYEAQYDYLTSAKQTNADDRYIHQLNIRSILNIEGAPYQFLPSVDRRIDYSENTKEKGKTSNNSYALGRKYTEKIVTQMPLLFIAPCNPAFMDDKTWEGSDKSLLLSAFGNAIDNLEELVQGSGKFYSAKYAYVQYYNYLNVMLAAVAKFLGLGEKEVIIGSDRVKLKNADWSKETTADFANTYLSKQNLLFYIDSIDTITENFANSTMQSQIAGLINGFSETAKEIDYFFGASSDNLISELWQKAGDAMSAVGNVVSGILSSGTVGGIVNSLSKDGITSIVDGGKIIFPEMWADSSFDRSYSIGMKLRSPDNDSLSIFLNVLKPYCKILCLTLPHMIGDNVNTYRSPFIAKAYCKGLFNVDLGMITGLSVSKGATCCWNDDGLPTQIDLDIELKDLYSQLSMTGFEEDRTGANLSLATGTLSSLFNTPKQIYNIVNNTSYMDFLANMAGLNINDMEWSRKAKVYYDLFTNRLKNVPNEVFGNRLTGLATSFMARIYNLL